MIFDGDIGIAEAAADRWNARAATRKPHIDKLASGNVAEVESPERIKLRLDRLARAAARAPVMTAPEGPTLVETIGLERVLGRTDFLGVDFLERALAVSRFVGRVNVRLRPGRTTSFGTGFMVSPRLLITNNHVLPNAAAARHSEVEFDYQHDRAGRLLPVVAFALLPDLFFLTDTALDYTLVAVAEQSVRGAALRGYGWSRLIGTQGKALLGESMNIVQHPRGEAKQIVLRANELVDLFDDFAHYVADTEPGSSGSPVYNDQWEVVALHHSGVPRKENGKLLAKNGTPWTGGDPNDLDWVANEGIRVSSLVAHIAEQQLTPEAARLRDEMLTLEPPDPVEAARSATSPPASPAPLPQPAARAAGGRSVTLTIPITVTVSIGDADGAPAPAAALHPAAARSGAQAAQGALATGTTAALAAERRAALMTLEASRTRGYYDEAADRRARDAYYREVARAVDGLGPTGLFSALSTLVRATHRRALSYRPAIHLYPWVDLHDGARRSLRSIYSGKDFDPAEFIEADLAADAERQRLFEMLAAQTNAVDHEQTIALIEAELPYNCEHVVPQSWFGKREPMRGDLHHLFACEVACNSFRGNHAYYDFPAFEEAIRDDCGMREEGRFEPAAGKGAVARATLYFLLRYPGEIGNGARELPPDRLGTLLDWHRRYPVGAYERHRNAAIEEAQGNRNPLIDWPEWAERIDFKLGFRGA